MVKCLEVERDPPCCPAAAWSRGVCRVDVTASDLMTSGSKQPRRGPEWLAEAKQTRVLCLLVGFMCLKAVPRCFQSFCCVCSSKNAWLNQAHWIFILSAAFCSRSQILICQEKAFSSSPAAVHAFLCPFCCFCPSLGFYFLSSATFILNFPYAGLQ